MPMTRFLLARIPFRHWAIWQVSKRSLVGYVLAVDALALAGLVVALVVLPIRQVNSVDVLLLIACSVLYTELSLPIEKMQERYRGAPSIDLNAVWMFAAVLLLHPVLSAVVIFVAYFTTWIRVRPNELYFRTFSVAATVIAGLAAVAFLRLVSDESFAEMPRNSESFAVVFASALIFLIVNSALITGSIFLGTPHRKLWRAFGQMPDYALEAATVALGILLSWALVDWPVVVLLIMGIMLVLHRSVLIRQLRDQARADPKTGLLNSATWFKDAAAELDRSTTKNAALLMLDLDHFKMINDRHGHLIGDKHLRGVADVLKAEVRATDLVGRFGGEEFVILLPSTAQADALAIAERIRRRVATVAIEGLDSVTVSVGVAAHPDHGETLEEVVSAADRALLAAKTAGRNRTLLFAD